MTMSHTTVKIRKRERHSSVEAARCRTLPHASVKPIKAYENQTNKAIDTNQNQATPNQANKTTHKQRQTTRMNHATSPFSFVCPNPVSVSRLSAVRAPLLVG